MGRVVIWGRRGVACQLPAASASGLEINGINLRANESKCAYLLCQRMICMICTHRTAPFVHTRTHNPCRKSEQSWLVQNVPESSPSLHPLSLSPVDAPRARPGHCFQTAQGASLLKW